MLLAKIFLPGGIEAAPYRVEPEKFTTCQASYGSFSSLSFNVNVYISIERLYLGVVPQPHMKL